MNMGLWVVLSRVVLLRCLSRSASAKKWRSVYGIRTSVLGFPDRRFSANSDLLSVMLSVLRTAHHRKPRSNVSIPPLSLKDDLDID